MKGNGVGTDLVILSHHKCATNWLRAICDELVRKEIITIQVKGGRPSYLDEEVQMGVKSVLLNVNATEVAASSLLDDREKNIHFVRDPRDALVSNYFSWRFSHQRNNDTILEFRQRSEELSNEEGMLALLDDFPMGVQLEKWTDRMWENTILYKYEDLLDDFEGGLRSIFSKSGIELSDSDLADIKEATSFRKMSGRDQGDEDQKKHFRKGVAGDWENYATSALSEAFNIKYGWLVKRLGYRE